MSFKITDKDYDMWVKKASPNSKIFVNMLLAFLVGGFICSLGQVIMNTYIIYGISKEDASAFTSVTMIFIGALLTALNIYGDIARYGGAGTLVPITGFSNGVVSSAMEFKSEGLIMGMGAKLFTIAGPVLVFGTITGVVCGIIKYIMLMMGW